MTTIISALGWEKAEPFEELSAGKNDTVIHNFFFLFWMGPSIRWCLISSWAIWPWKPEGRREGGQFFKHSDQEKTIRNDVWCEWTWWARFGRGGKSVWYAVLTQKDAAKCWQARSLVKNDRRGWVPPILNTLPFLLKPPHHTYWQESSAQSKPRHGAGEYHGRYVSPLTKLKSS